MQVLTRWLWSCATACLLAAPLCHSAPLTAAQALAYVRIGELQFSPDGTQLSCVVVSYQWDALPRIRLFDLATGRSREITPPGKSERSPEWAPDGRLAFLSNRGGRTQVYLAAPSGEPVALTNAKFGVERFHWSPDGVSIAYLAAEDSAHNEDRGPQVADLEGDLARLWIIDPGSRAVRRVGGSGYRIDDFQWQDATHLLVVATDQPRLEEHTDAVYRLDTTAGMFTPLARPAQPFDALLVSPDGTQFAVRSTAAGGPIPRDLFVGGSAGGPLRNLSAPVGLAVAEARWRERRNIWMLAIDGFYRRIYHIAGNRRPVRLELPGSVAAFDVSRQGLVAYVGEDFAHLPEVFVRSRGGKVRQLAEAQPEWSGYALAPTTVFQTRAPDGVSLEAALMRPPAPRQSKLPLVLLVHGGPASNFSAGYGWITAWAQLLATNGYQVLMVNPRGSNGYSEEFLKANRGDWGGGDYRDLMTVLDAVLARGATDPQRLGIGGWSYGAEMATWATTQTARFRAAVAGAPVFDQQAEFETERGPEDDEWYFGTPWEHPEVFARNSPATYIRNSRTPTLILAGDEDVNNPVGQSKGLYRALKHFGVETEMVLYPGEGHSPRRGSNNIDMFERILGWYNLHLGEPAGVDTAAAR